MGVNEKKTTIWWIEEDDEIFDILKKDVYNSFPYKEDYEIIIERLEDAPTMLEKVGSPDIVLIDVCGMFQGVQPLGCWDLFPRTLAGLINAHPGAGYGIYSLVGAYASALVGDFIEDMEEDDIFIMKELKCDTEVGVFGEEFRWFFEQIIKGYVDSKEQK